MKINLRKVFWAVFVSCLTSYTALLLSSCSNMSDMSFSNMLPSFSAKTENAPIYQSNSTTLWEGQPATIWNKLQHNSISKLKKIKASSNNPNEIAWVELALISKQRSTPYFINALIAWRERYPAHPGNSLFPSNQVLRQISSTVPPQQIAILLPQQGPYASASRAVKEGFLKAYYANLHHGIKQNVKFYDTTQKNVASVYQTALSDGADFVVGPLVKEEVQRLVHSASFSRTTLALNYTDGYLPSNVYEFGLLPEDEAAQIANRARGAGLSRALIIAPASAWGRRLASSVTAQWQALGGSVQETLFYTAPKQFNAEIARLLKIDTKEDKKLMEKSNNKNLLEQQRRQDFDVIFLFAQPQNAHLLVPLLRYYYVSNVPIYASSAVYSGKANPVRDVDINGVIICDVPWNTEGGAKTGIQADRLYAVGQDAYVLSQSFPRLTQISNFPLYGMTGALYLSADHKIHRRVPCSTIRNGLLQ